MSISLSLQLSACECWEEVGAAATAAAVVASVAVAAAVVCCPGSCPCQRKTWNPEEELEAVAAPGFVAEHAIE